VEIRTEVLIIGGGATGVGIARDLALRGIPSLLIERRLPWCLDGTTVFHSGGGMLIRGEALRMHSENKILRQIAPLYRRHGGLFISSQKMALIS
jgi:glycerol-3-phosphate dehydrogenase